MGNNRQLIDELRKQETELVFERFNSNDALKIGLKLIDKGRGSQVAFAFRISLNHRQLFHFSMDGCAPDHDRWIARKENIVYHFFASSYRKTLEFADENQILNPRFGLSDDTYVLAGGSFPITVKGLGVVGAITISGMRQEEDHDYIISVIRDYLKKSEKEIHI